MIRLINMYLSQDRYKTFNEFFNNNLNPDTSEDCFLEVLDDILKKSSEDRESLSSEREIVSAIATVKEYTKLYARRD